jgi:hypothetical protein
MTKKLRCNRLKLKEGALPAVERWAEECNRRSNEVAETLLQEGIRLEVVALEQASDGDYLIFLMETDDYDRALEVFKASTLPIDEYHRQFLADNVIESVQLRVLSCHEPTVS